STVYIIAVKRLQRGVHAVAGRRAGIRQGMLSHITALYLIPALPHNNFIFQRFSLAQLFY
ncbi:hypothetical protein, partial [Dorea sp. D27]|uniref:hypothetical protein n=1 Tax=Dorea sp. D27 TaxID=658665 RepID=UPI001A9A635F